VTAFLLVLVAAGAAALWWAWLGHGTGAACARSYSGPGTWIVAIAIMFGGVGVVDRFRAWQTRSKAGSVGLDIAAFWLALICVMAATVLFAAVHHCFE
jgi:hypothetical protein